MQRLKKFLSLSAGEQRLFLLALVLLPIIVILLRLTGYRRTSALVLGKSERQGPSASSSEDLDKAIADARTVRRAADHGPVKANCLPRALLLQRILQGQGIDCVIRFGVQNDGNDLEAHAWVESHGVCIDGETSTGQTYRPLQSPGENDAGGPDREDRLVPDRPS